MTKAVDQLFSWFWAVQVSWCELYLLHFLPFFGENFWASQICHLFMTILCMPKRYNTTAAHIRTVNYVQLCGLLHVFCWWKKICSQTIVQVPSSQVKITRNCLRFPFWLVTSPFLWFWHPDSCWLHPTCFGLLELFGGFNHEKQAKSPFLNHFGCTKNISKFPLVKFYNVLGKFNA